MPAGRKQPYYMVPRDGGLLGLAGIRGLPAGEGRQQATCCVLTTAAATAQLAAVHDRMPLVLRPEDWPLWLGSADGGEAESLLTSQGADSVTGLELRPVASDVGDVRNDGAELIRRMAHPDMSGHDNSAGPQTLF